MASCTLAAVAKRWREALSGLPVRERLKEPLKGTLKGTLIGALRGILKGGF